MRSLVRSACRPFLLLALALGTAGSGSASSYPPEEPEGQLFVEIGDFVWHDLNGNGLQDPLEPGVPNVKVNVYIDLDKDGSVDLVDMQLTDAAGLYFFRVPLSEPASNYTVEVDASNFLPGGPLAGFVQTLPLQGPDRTIDSNGSPTSTMLMPPQQEDLTLDFGYVREEIACELEIDKFCAPVPPTATGDDCHGKVRELVFEFTGDDCSVGNNPQDGKAQCSGDAGMGPVDVVVTKDADKVFATPDTGLALGDTFSVQKIESGQVKDMPSDTKLRLDGALGSQSITLHTSCSQPLGVGDRFGALLLVSLTTTEGGTVVLPPPPGPSTQSECEVPASGAQGCQARPVEIVFRYTGLDCSASNNAQAPDKTDCSGDPAGAQPVSIAYTGKDPEKFTLTPASGITVGSTFRFTATGRDELHSDSSFDIGPGLQTVKLHTSCSQPLLLGDRYGSLEVVGFTDKDGNTASIGAEVRYDYVVTNPNGAEAVVDITDDVLGPIATELVVPAEGSSTVSVTRLVEADTVNTATVTGTVEGLECFEDTATATVTFVTPPTPPGSCADGKPTALVFEYTGASCGATTNLQNGKLQCSGDPMGAEPVQLVMTRDADKISVDLSSIDVGDLVTISRNDGNSFASDTELQIRQGASVLQSLKIHTSCSQQLDVGDVFGSLTLRGFVPTP